MIASKARRKAVPRASVLPDERSAYNKDMEPKYSEQGAAESRTVGERLAANGALTTRIWNRNIASKVRRGAVPPASVLPRGDGSE